MVSSEREPEHTYTMPGIYYLSLKLIDEYGNEWYAYKDKEVRVYDYDYSANGVNTSRTYNCYRIPVEAKHGYGPSEYQDAMDYMGWLWPGTGCASTCIARDEDGNEVALVKDAKTGVVGQINDPDVWTDRKKADYGGSSYNAIVAQPARFSPEGEHVPIRHTEGHRYFKPYDREQANMPGYDSEGYPEGLKVSLGLIKDGSLAGFASSTEDVPKDGDLVYPDIVEARTLQEYTGIEGAPWLMIGTEGVFHTVDKAARPSLRKMTETTYRKHLSAMPLFHITRNRTTPLLNNATGAEATGVAGGRVDGPDGENESAIRFVAPDLGITDTSPEAVSGDFTLLIWLNSILAGDLPLRVWDIGAFHVDIVAGWQLQIDDGVTPVITHDLEGFAGMSWVCLVIVRDSLYYRVGENSQDFGNYAMVSVENYGTAIECCTLAPCSMFDAKVLPRSISVDEYLYYYNNVTEKNGIGVLQPF